MMDAAAYKRGDRVKLVHMDDPYCKDIPIGMTGTVTGTCPKPINVLNVDWDCDFYLNPCLDVDIVEKIGHVG